jgi:hypothetical protein
MASLRIKTWPFAEGQEAKLVWFGSPHTDYRGNWRLRVAFRATTGELKVISYPWGLLPYLRLGQIYADGVYDQVAPLEGSAFKVTIDGLDQGVVETGFALPKRLIDFHKNPELGLQKVIQYRSDGLTFCLPVTELIRALFINSRYLSYYLLQPHGLDLLIDRGEFQNNTFFLDLSSRVPAKLANDTNARHLSWIHLDPGIHSMWDSVYGRLFSQAVKLSRNNPTAAFRKGVPLDVELPSTGKLELHVRGVQFINHVLVKEIIAISGFRHPVGDIVFWHPSKKRHESIYGDKKLRLSPKSNNDDYVINDQSENAKEDTNQDVLETPPTYMRFTNYPIVTTRRESIRHSRTGDDVLITTGRGGKSSGMQEVSVQDSVVGGDTPPIDFQTLETIPYSDAVGLEAFFEMIQIMKRTFPYSIRMSVLRVPSGKRFSTCSNGDRRACAIVHLTTANSQVYIIEVARPDNWSISTLLLFPGESSSTSRVEGTIKKLLETLVQKGGHWDQNIFNQHRGINFDKVKHYRNDDIGDWMYRIVAKLSNSLGLK